jgi:hypothetical protein
MNGPGRLILALAMLIAPPAARSGEPAGIGVLGDSYSDEYRFYPPDRSTARNWVELLAEVRGVDFGPYTESSRGEPRNGGFSYNWARSDAETGDLIASGQHLGVAEQVARGEVSVVVVFAGGNDFIHALHSADPISAIGQAVPRAVANERLAVETVLGASPRVRLLLLTLPDLLELPEFSEPIREGHFPEAIATACREGIRRYNDEIRAIASSSDRVGLLDLEWAARLAFPIGRGRVLLAGQVLDRDRPANDPGHLFLADRRHLGSFGQAVLAKLIVDALDAQFGLGIEPLRLGELPDLARPSPGVPASVASASPAGPILAPRPPGG